MRFELSLSVTSAGRPLRPSTRWIWLYDRSTLSRRDISHSPAMELISLKESTSLRSAGQLESPSILRSALPCRSRCVMASSVGLPPVRSSTSSVITITSSERRATLGGMRSSVIADGSIEGSPVPTSSPSLAPAFSSARYGATGRARPLVSASSVSSATSFACSSTSPTTGNRTLFCSSYLNSTRYSGSTSAWSNTSQLRCLRSGDCTRYTESQSGKALAHTPPPSPWSSALFPK